MNTQSQIISDLISHVTSECSTIDREQRFRDMLDDCYSFDKVGGPFAHMSPSSVLEEVDPAAFRCGVNDYMDGQEVEIEGDYYDPEEVEVARESFLSELEDEESEKEQEISDFIPEKEETKDSELSELEAELADIQAKIAEVRNYTF